MNDLNNFPSASQYTGSVAIFATVNPLQDYIPTSALSNLGVGSAGAIIAAPTMMPPSYCAYADMNGVQFNLDNVSAVQNDFVQLQADSGPLLASRLSASYQGNTQKGVTYQMTFRLQLDSATLTQCMVGWFGANTNVMGTNVANGFGFYCNQSAAGAPGTGNWWTVLANGAAAQYTNYTQMQGPATATTAITLSMRYEASGSLLGGGRLTYYADTGAGPNVIGAMITDSGSAIFPYATPLFPTVAFGNGSAVARQPVLFEIGWQAYAE